MATEWPHRSGVIRPRDMTMLQGVLDQLLKEKNLSTTDAGAEALAARIIELFQSGIRDPDALKIMVD